MSPGHSVPGDHPRNLESMSDKTTTLADVCRAANAEGVWADTFDCVVNRADPRNGNKPSKADVYDPANGTQAKLAWFGGDLTQYQGKVIRIGGKGNKAKLYNGATEISVGKNGTITPMGEASQQNAPKTTTPPTGGAGNPPPPPNDRPKVDPVTFFHREMSKQSLGYLHCLQYAQDIHARAKVEITPEQFQACVSSLYIEGNKRGLFNLVPKLRDVDDKSLPVRYVPPQPDPVAVAAEQARKAAEAEARRKAEEAEAAAEAARKAANQPHTQENLDEDVPF